MERIKKSFYMASESLVFGDSLVFGAKMKTGRKSIRSQSCLNSL